MAHQLKLGFLTKGEVTRTGGEKAKIKIERHKIDKSAGNSSRSRIPESKGHTSGENHTSQVSHRGSRAKDKGQV